MRVANDAGCDAVHPGYGFLAESADFARRCAAAGVTFVGPRPETLELLGDKSEARALAERCGVPVLPGTRGAATLEDARRFFRALAAGDAMVIKAIAGGGGRGMRIVATLAALDDAYQRCRSEALAAFGNGDVYVERLMPRARHVEVQIVGDGSGAVASLGDRDCSVQRRHQKLLELAPAPSLPARLRDRLTDAALRLAREVRFASLGTFEFLVDANAAADAPRRRSPSSRRTRGSRSSTRSPRPSRVSTWCRSSSASPAARRSRRSGSRNRRFPSRVASPSRRGSTPRPSTPPAPSGRRAA